VIWILKNALCPCINQTVRGQGAGPPIGLDGVAVSATHGSRTPSRSGSRQVARVEGTVRALPPYESNALLTSTVIVPAIARIVAGPGTMLHSEPRSI
jgi:hypothetical protein